MSKNLIKLQTCYNYGGKGNIFPIRGRIKTTLTIDIFYLNDLSTTANPNSCFYDVNYVYHGIKGYDLPKLFSILNLGLLSSAKAKAKFSLVQKTIRSDAKNDEYIYSSVAPLSTFNRKIVCDFNFGAFGSYSKNGISLRLSSSSNSGIEFANQTIRGEIAILGNKVKLEGILIDKNLLETKLYELTLFTKAELSFVYSDINAFLNYLTDFITQSNAKNKNKALDKVNLLKQELDKLNIKLKPKIEQSQELSYFEEKKEKELILAEFMNFVDERIKPELNSIYKIVFQTKKSLTLKDGLSYVMNLTNNKLNIYDNISGLPINI